VRRGRRIRAQQLDPLLVDRLMIPGRLRQEPLQPLHLAVLGAGDRLGVGQGGQGLVAVAGHQQALQVVAQAAALRERAKQRVELLGVGSSGPGAGGPGRRMVIGVVAPGGGWHKNRAAKDYTDLNKLPIARSYR
jgi:hypothetical protein